MRQSRACPERGEAESNGDPVALLQAPTRDGKPGLAAPRLRYGLDSAEFTLSERSESNGLRSE